ncbi:glutamine synthetase family protein [Crenobacter sp. SG2303]|uniref:Glutamine synthetase family protein n=1 Tax=Crenobacter oryzisoli TaxID=3056844 RepID=A0ABT7XNZ6_9NEIS|nr:MULTISPECIES: glutamine synthetase family protein [unclassified Crenobacter]MDN0075455.1 glutamine synthetase family protein [Crenobacter sp. SG2303]MDN0083118.1 glutamine synthetase family protein [Crenobacter sp. SG2305]
MNNEIFEWLREHRITEVECILPDMTGVARGKIIPKDKFVSEPEMRLPEAVLIQTVTGDYPDDSMLDLTDPDMVLQPDPNTLRFVPWAVDPTAQLIFDCFRANGQAVETAPRNVLRRVLALYEEKGWEPVIAPEMEFYLLSPNPDPDIPLAPPIGRTGRAEFGRRSYAIDAVNEFDPLFEDIYDYCHAQNLEVDTLIHEIGTAQMEINFLHGNPMDLADQVFLFKRTVREAAFRHNMYATFMAKPMEGEPGSAMHMHQSVIDHKTGKNIFSNEDGTPSEHFFHYIGGLQKYLPSAMPFFAPYVNSYRRLTRYTAAPTNIEWGYDNRTVGLRVPHSSPAGRRVENRVPGVDVNPYIAMAATLACGYLGMANQIGCSEPMQTNAYELPYQFPSTAEEALDKLRTCPELAEVMGSRFVEMYLGVKEKENAEYFRVISPWERKFLLLHV